LSGLYERQTILKLKPLTFRITHNRWYLKIKNKTRGRGSFSCRERGQSDEEGEKRLGLILGVDSGFYFLFCVNYTNFPLSLEKIQMPLLSLM
jgi:hypothetical protein